jgi:hypothetical protein
MSEHASPPELPDDVREVLRAAREAPAIGPERIAHIRRGAERSLAQESLPPPRATRVWHRVVWLAAGVALGAAGATWFNARPTRTVPAPRVVLPLDANPRPPTADASPPQPLIRDDAAADSAQPRAAERRATPPDDPSRAERALIERARSALQRNDPAAAIDAAREHGRRFPHGALVEEREALFIRSLVGTQRAEEARARADSFLRRWPRSLFRPSIETALRR